MSKNKYLLVSLPTNICLANDHDEALTALRSTVTTDNGTTLPFQIPNFKVGTLDTLVQQADQLGKLESTCEGVVSKIGDSLSSVLAGDEQKISQQKIVNDSQLNACQLYLEYSHIFKNLWISIFARSIGIKSSTESNDQ